jgi:hypothetical protein
MLKPSKISRQKLLNLPWKISALYLHKLVLYRAGINTFFTGEAAAALGLNRLELAMPYIVSEGILHQLMM